MQRPLQVVSVAMASFGDGYQETSGLMQFASSLLNSGKYLLDPELRGKQVIIAVNYLVYTSMVTK